MEPKNFYKFCPKCGGELIVQKEEQLVCKKCGFYFYINPLPCNAAIIENKKGEILLVKRKFDPMKGFWDWPGGFINPGESLEDSVKREIREELGVEIKTEKIVGVYEDRYFFQGIQNYVICMVVSAKITEGIIKADDDIAGYSYFPKKDVLKQKFAFPSINKGVSDYLNKSL